MGAMKKWVSLKKRRAGKVAEEEEEELTWRRLTWRPWRRLSSSAMKWKRLDFIQKGIMDNVVFRVMYVVEALVLVSTLCFFYLCCGCHI
ncbi:PREDICTED: uncharacterized protein LOC104800829 [Tarenaya hassleriana]|uniref:uncharacterized protein LOC104800829 n=1 Tax=Tarenaya hassleriana TaxID=28532 RepID=UPI00053C8B65|nr:PREDICTED: uncharacterized protein LOC104800829 [Tarenaya hassleriana]